MVREILPLISKASRYLGSEVNSIHKDFRDVDLKFVLAFPDVYEIGMSYVGFHILYNILNKRKDIVCERVYAPWADMEKVMRAKRLPLTSLESSLPLKEFDIVGFSLQYELCNTNILNMLDLGGIPFFSRDRDREWPLIIAGGPCTYNPEPVADFFDAVILGDGEEAILDVCDCFLNWKRGGGEKEDLYQSLSKIEGVYIPSFFNVRYQNNGAIKEIIPLKEGYSKVRRRVVPDLNSIEYPTEIIIPFMNIVHDRLSVEIARGCTRGCRFCQAGMTYRPVRERSPEIIKEIVIKGLEKTGYEDFSLLSLNTGDYSCIKDLLIDLMNSYSGKNIAVSLPSLRPGTLTPELVDEIKRVRRTGVTIAPEAGTQRLRDVINKGVTEEEILTAAETLFSAGWNSIKLYFMIGLPTEKEEDIEGIVELVKKVLLCGKGRKTSGNINVSISTFVPKPQTPFQWDPQISFREIVEKHNFFKKQIRGKRLRLKWQDPGLSVLEGVFARGDRRLSEVLVRAHGYGCRLDAWTEHFKYDLWEKAIADARLDMDFYRRERRDYNEPLPWGHLDCLVNKNFLIEEREKGLNGILTPDCRNQTCSGCGVCDNNDLMPVISGSFERTRLNEHLSRPDRFSVHRRYRLRFSKLGDGRFLSHLELNRIFSRAIRRAEVPIRYSKGFHPLPRIIFGQALSVGIESLAEYCDIEVEGHINNHELIEKLNRQLPEAIKILNCREIPLKSKPLSDNMRKLKYLVSRGNQGETPFWEVSRLNEAVASFLKKDSFPVIQKKKRGTKKIDLRFMVEHLELKSDLSMEIDLRFGMSGEIKPFEMVKHIFQLKQDEVILLRILRIEEGLEDNPK